MNEKDFEIMAPVGSYESLMAAIQGGADSIYFGIEGLNMRSRSSNNFTTDDLRKIVAICQEHGLKSYLTVNTVIYGEDLPLMREIIDAAKHDDNLSIELIEEVGEKAGKAVAFLINTFNPETVIVGGELAEASDYLMLPLKSATNKYSLNLVYKDTKFRLSKMGKTASAWGAAMLIRNQVLGLC